MAILLFLVQVIVGVYSRKVFLDFLGNEVLGLNTTLGNILNFMNLAELGIGVAMSTSLYRPIHERDHETICEIISVQGLLYRYVALLLCIVGGVIMLVLPFIFPHTECGLLYVYVTFAVFLFSSLTSYLWNYRQILIYADQKNYRIMPWMHGQRYLVIGMQLLCLTVFHGGIWSWIVLELIGSIMGVFIINYVLKTEYPWLHVSLLPPQTLLRKYRNLIIKTRQLFVHKLASFVLDQTAPLIIYGFVSLTMVTYYSNYMIIVGYVSVLLRTIFNGMGASIGSLVSEGDRHHTLDVFWELFTSRLWMAALACFGIYLFIGPTISLWLGSQYVLGERTLLFLLVGVFIRLSRSVIDSFKDAYQLFADVWAPAVEAALNLGCSVTFGYLWGLDGILMGSNMSLILIVLLWKPYYLFRHGFRASCRTYYKYYALHVLLLVCCAVLLVVCWPVWPHAESELLQLLVPLPCYLSYIALTYVMLLLTTKGMQQFTQRIRNIFYHRV